MSLYIFKIIYKYFIQVTLVKGSDREDETTVNSVVYPFEEYNTSVNDIVVEEVVASHFLREKLMKKLN